MMTNVEHDHQLINGFHVVNMYYNRLTFIVPLVLCLIHSLSSSFNLSQQSNKPTSSTLSSSTSTSPSPTSSVSSSEEEALGRTKSLHKQAIFNKGFGLLGIGSGCCPCSECCLCQPPLSPLPGDYPDPGIIEDPNGPIIPGLYNRFGSTATLSSSSSRRVVRRRYVRPNGLMVVEIEEQPGGFRGSGLFGGGLFSRLIPSALENGGNFSRRQQITQKPITGLQDRYSLNNNQRRTRIRVNHG